MLSIQGSIFRITYTVLVETLNPAQSINQSTFLHLLGLASYEFWNTFVSTNLGWTGRWTDNL